MLTVAIAALLIIAFAAHLSNRVIGENRAMAEAILRTLRNNFPPEAEFRFLAPEELPAVSVAPLRDAALAFADAGFAPLADVANLSLNDSDGSPIPMRIAVRADEGMQACAYFHPALDELVFDISSDLSDGRTLTTSTASMASKLDAPPEIERRYLPPGAPFATVVRAHRDRLADLRRAAPALTVNAASSREALLADLHREVRRKHEYRRGIGWLTESEFRRVTPQDIPAERMDAVYAQLRKLVGPLAS
jgi:hypothetical protein